MFKVGSAEIVSRRKRLLVALDGEVEILKSPLRYSTRPGALRVFVPAETGACDRRAVSRRRSGHSLMRAASLVGAAVAGRLAARPLHLVPPPFHQGDRGLQGPLELGDGAVEV